MYRQSNYDVKHSVSYFDLSNSRNVETVINHCQITLCPQLHVNMHCAFPLILINDDRASHTLFVHLNRLIYNS